MIEGLRPSVPLRLTPHPDAPLMQREDSLVILYQAMGTLLSGHFTDAQEDVRQVVRQAALSNLWFYLRFVAGYSGPFTKLTPHLHAEVCNFYQTSVENPGSKKAIFLSRSSYKTTIFTPGGNAWEITRDPNLQIGTVSAVAERAEEFLATTQEIFTKNEFVQWLFPDHYVPNPNQLKGWKGNALTLPNKTRDFSKPNIKAIGALGSTQGVHVDLFKVDDPVGEDMLNAERQAGAIMRRVENWMFGSFRTLLVDPKNSRILVAGTRYGEADVFGKITKNSYNVVGNPEEYEDEINPDGSWEVYWRPARSADGEIYFPENFDHKFLDDLRQEDPWAYFTQYENKVQNAMTSEFREYDLEKFKIDRDVRGYGWNIEVQDDPYAAPENMNLENMDLVMAIDPAASEKKTSSRTSRSVVVVVATDWKMRHFIVDLRVGFAASTKVFDWIFELFALYPSIRIIGMEQQGPFKSWGPFLYEEMRRRDVSLPVTSAPAKGDKVARIRMHLQPLLFRRKLFARESQYSIIMDEVKVFPDGKLMDILDALSIANSLSIVPGRRHAGRDEDYGEEDPEEEFATAGIGIDPYTGY